MCWAVQRRICPFSTPIAISSRTPTRSSPGRCSDCRDGPRRDDLDCGHGRGGCLCLRPLLFPGPLRHFHLSTELRAVLDVNACAGEIAFEGSPLSDFDFLARGDAAGDGAKNCHDLGDDVRTNLRVGPDHQRVVRQVDSPFHAAVDRQVFRSGQLALYEYRSTKCCDLTVLCLVRSLQHAHPPPGLSAQYDRMFRGASRSARRKPDRRTLMVPSQPALQDCFSPSRCVSSPTPGRDRFRDLRLFSEASRPPPLLEMPGMFLARRIGTTSCHWAALEPTSPSISAPPTPASSPVDAASSSTNPRSSPSIPLMGASKPLVPQRAKCWDGRRHIFVRCVRSRMESSRISTPQKK